jgi:hypothetical protein
MAKSKGSKEFEQPSYLGMAGEPAQTDMGASRINYGEQRYGMGVTDEEPETYVDPGEEGETAVRIMISRGGIGSHESFDSPMSGTPTGE